jgi:hypothetical protein
VAAGNKPIKGNLILKTLPGNRAAFFYAPEAAKSLNSYACLTIQISLFFMRIA